MATTYGLMTKLCFNELGHSALVKLFLQSATKIGDNWVPIQKIRLRYNL